MKFKHTPGPWRAEQVDGIWRIEDENNCVIAVLEQSANAGANAYLIAASPRLLDVLANLSECRINNQPAGDMNWEEAEATIQSAIGQGSLL